MFTVGTKQLIALEANNWKASAASKSGPRHTTLLTTPCHHWHGVTHDQIVLHFLHLSTQGNLVNYIFNGFSWLISQLWPYTENWAESRGWCSFMGGRSFMREWYYTQMTIIQATIVTYNERQNLFTETALVDNVVTEYTARQALEC